MVGTAGSSLYAASSSGRPSGLMRTWEKLSAERGERLAHPRAGEEQGQRLAPFRGAGAVVEFFDLMVRLVLFRFLLRWRRPGRSRPRPTSRRRNFLCSPQDRPAGMVVQVIEARLVSLLSSRLKEKRREFSSHWKLPMAPSPCEVNTRSPFSVSRISSQRLLAAAAGQLAQGDRDPPRPGTGHIMDGHRVQHVLHVAAAAGVQGDLRAVRRRKPACFSGWPAGMALAGAGREDALDQQQVLAVGQGQRVTSLPVHPAGGLGQRPRRPGKPAAGKPPPPPGRPAASAGFPGKQPGRPPACRPTRRSERAPAATPAAAGRSTALSRPLRGGDAAAGGNHIPGPRCHLRAGQRRWPGSRPAPGPATG